MSVLPGFFFPGDGSFFSLCIPLTNSEWWQGEVKNVETSTLLSHLIEIGWLASKVIEQSDAQRGLKPPFP